MTNGEERKGRGEQNEERQGREDSKGVKDEGNDGGKEGMKEGKRK